MVKLKYIKLENFCGYRNFEYDFYKSEDFQKWLMVYGPNGSFKSTLLNAVSLLSSPWRLESRLENVIFFRRLTYHPDYRPGYEKFLKSDYNLYMEAIFDIHGKDRKVVLQNNWDEDSTGVLTNEMPEGIISVSFNPKADSPMSVYSFQLNSKYEKEFIDFAEAVYGFKVELPKDSLVEEYCSENQEYMNFYTNFILYKYRGDKIHYKNFSDGEKKIATLIATLFNRIYDREGNENSILLIDNICMHIYYIRHMYMIEKMDYFFPNNQIIATTHSPIVIEGGKGIKGMSKKYLFDMESYIKTI